MSKTYQDIEIKVKNVINEKFKSFNYDDKSDFNKIISIANQMDELETKISILESTFNDLFATTTRLIVGKAEEEASTGNVVKQQISNVLEQATKPDTTEDSSSGFGIFTWILFGLVIISLVIVFRKYFKLKKSHIL